MDVKEAEERLLYIKSVLTIALDNKSSEAIETVLSELEKKEAIINLMAKQLVEAHGWFYSKFDNFKEENWIEYFTKKCEGK